MIDKGHCYVEDIGEGKELLPHGENSWREMMIRLHDYENSSTRLIAIEHNII